jgi:uncharacterized membrane protein
MEAGLILLAILYVVGLPVAVIVLLVQMSDLKGRMAKLERDRAMAAPTPETRPMQAPAAPDAETIRAPMPKAAEAPRPPEVEAAARSAARFAPAEAKAPSQTAKMAPPKAPNQATVLRSDRASDLSRWLTANWVYVVSAASLALAGVFFVQYGMEHGLLPPGLRVMFGLGFGAALIAVGEWLRRKHGDRGAHALLPQVFSGAGIVSAFAAVVAARLIYGLIGVETAFAGQVVIAGIAVWLGWINGPLLAAVGLIGAAAAPFLVGGGQAPAPWLFAYFGLIAGAGLAVDSYRRWAWVSVLALVLGLGGGAMMHLGGGDALAWVLLLTLMPVLATIIPARALVPDHAGPPTLAALQKGGDWPLFPTRLVLGTLLFSTFGLIAATDGLAETAQIAFGALAALAVLYLLWADRAEGLADLPLLPSAGMLVAIGLVALDGTSLWYQFADQAILNRPPETGPPWTVSLILAGAVLVSLAFALRALTNGNHRLLHGLGAVLTAPIAAAGLELAWDPAPVLGAYPWALHVLGVAGLMVALALRFARADGEDRRRAAHAALSALSLIALALFILTTKTALSLALAALIVIAAFLDRRFRLPEMGLFIQAGVAVLSYRLLIDPGLDWAFDAELPQVLLAFGGAIAGLLAGLWAIRGLGRNLTEGVLTSAAWGFGAVAANIIIARVLIAPSGKDDFTHWGIALHGMPWLVVALVQLYRAGLGSPLWITRARYGLAALAGMLALGALGVALTILNPLFWDSSDNRILGVSIVNTLALAYGLPGAAMLIAALRFRALPAALRLGMRWGGMALIATYAVLALRHFWQGPQIGLWRGTGQAELYSYTVALLILGAALLWQAIARRSVPLRRLAMGVIAITVAKVFFVDISGLSGLTRVASFLGLGLALAGLAWLNRWAGQEMGEKKQG